MRGSRAQDGPDSTRESRERLPALPECGQAPSPSGGGHIMRLRPQSAFGATLAAVVVMACAVPAQATVIAHDHYSFSESFPDVICGVSVRHDVVGSGVAHVRVGKGELDTLFFGIDNYEWTDTLTNEANGNFVLIEHNGVVHDIKGTHVEGSIFEATTIFPGQP